MKPVVLLLFSFILFISCTDQNTGNTETVVTETIVEKVYGWSDPELNGTNCNQLQRSAIALPRLLFLNDSHFIKIVPTECGDLGNCIRYYSGNYKLYDRDITFDYNSRMVVQHLVSKNLKSPYIEAVPSDDDRSRLMRQNCGNVPFFIECDVQAHLMMLKSDTFSVEVNRLKNEKVWQLLFEK